MPRVKTGNKREAIINAGVLLFSKNGFDRTSMDQIATRAGIAVGTVYLYFKTKDDILQGIFDRFITHHDRQLEQDLLSVKGARRKVELLVDSDLTTIMHAPDRARLFLFEMRRSSQCLGFIKEKLISRYEHYFSEILRSDSLNLPLGIHVTAVVLSGILENLLYDWVLHQNSLQTIQITKGILDFLVTSEQINSKITVSNPDQY